MSVGQQLLVFEELCKKEDHVQSFDNAVLAAVAYFFDSLYSQNQQERDTMTADCIAPLLCQILHISRTIEMPCMPVVGHRPLFSHASSGTIKPRASTRIQALDA
jgi:hypothetical protein